MVWITTGKSLYVTQKQMTHKHVWHETVIHMWQTTAHDTQAFLTWNSCPCVANNSKWHTIMFGMKQLSICGKQQQMTHKHFCQAVVHMWQTTANDIPACWTWNSYPYVANNSKWHTIIFDMKHLSICDKQQQMTQAFLTWNSYPYVANNSKWTQACLTWNSYPYVANNSKWHTSIFDMKELSICGKQQQMTYNHVWHETVIHMWQTTANDTQTCLTWNSYPSVANNSKWHRSIFDMKQLSICGKQQHMTHKNFDMKQLSMFYLFIYLKFILPFWLAKQ